MKIDVTALTLTSGPIQSAKLSLNSSAASANRLCALPASPNVSTTDTNVSLCSRIRSDFEHKLTFVAADPAAYRNVLIASGSLLPVTRMSTVRICFVGMLVAADSPVASSPAGFHEPTVCCTPSCVVTTMS
jgi:hypothetical protein